VRWRHAVGSDPTYCGNVIFNGPGDFAGNVLVLGVSCAAGQALADGSSESSGAPYETSIEGSAFRCTAVNTAVAYRPVIGLTYFVYHCGEVGGAAAVWFRRSS
jgi:hypothetical protein